MVLKTRWTRVYFTKIVAVPAFLRHTSTFLARTNLNACCFEADALLQLSPAITLVEAQAAVYPQVAPVQLPALKDGGWRAETCHN